MKSVDVQVFDPTTLKLVATIPADEGARNVTLWKGPRQAPLPYESTTHWPAALTLPRFSAIIRSSFRLLTRHHC
jgi:hypothetical protein